MKNISIAQTLAVWAWICFSFANFPLFWNRILFPKDDITGFWKFLPPKLIFPVDLKYVIWFCLAFWETEESIYISSGSEGFFLIFSKFKPTHRRGRVSSKSHLSHDWSISLWNTYEKKRQVHCKTKKFIKTRAKKATLCVFSTYVGSSVTLANSITN